MDDTAWLTSAAAAARLTLAAQSPARLRQNLSAWLATQTRRVHDRAFGARFASGCPIPGAAPRDYQQRVLTLPGFGRSLAGIRFLGGDTRQPFVDLLAWTTFPADPAEGIAALSESFAVFRPPRVRLLLAEAPPGGEPDQYWLAGRRSALVVPVDAEIAPGGPEDAPLVAQAYQATPPELQAHLTPSDAEDLADGVVVRLTVGGRWAGLAAARRGRRWALDGYEVIEEVLAPGFRGRGLGVVLQRALIAALPSGEDTAVFGTIHAKNAPSLGTARRCGRSVVGGWWFLPTGR